MPHLLTRLTESFAKYRWCPNIIGPQSGGEVNNLSIDVVSENGTDQIFGPLDVKIPDRKEYELSELGFIPLTMRKDTDRAVFFYPTLFRCQRNIPMMRKVDKPS